MDHNIALNQLKENRTWYLMLGIALVILGTLAIMFSITATIFSVMYLGVYLLIAGSFEAIHSFKLRKWSSFSLHLFLGILYIVSGFFIALNPEINALTLTLILAIFLVISGISRIIFSIITHSPYKGWLLFNGILTTIIGILIWYQWPVSGLWVIGTFIGIDSIFTGWSWIALSLMANKLTSK